MANVLLFVIAFVIALPSHAATSTTAANAPSRVIARTAYTPVFKNNAGTTCSNYTATGYYWRNESQELCLEVLATWTGTCAATSGALTFTLPTGLSHATSQLAGGTTQSVGGSSLLGMGWWLDSGTSNKTLFAHYQDADEIRMADSAGLVLDNSVATGDNIKFQELCIPVTGW